MKHTTTHTQHWLNGKLCILTGIFSGIIKIGLYLSVGIFSISFGNAQNHFVLTSTKPEAGSKMKFTYSGASATKQTKIQTLTFDLENRFSCSGQDIPVNYNNGEITGEFSLPDNVVYFGFKILNGDTIDNNLGMGYCFNVYKKGKPTLGTFFKEGSSHRFRNSQLNLKSDPQEAIALMEKEYNVHPALRKSTRVEYLDMLIQVKGRKSEAIKLAQGCFKDEIKSSKNDENLRGLISIIANQNQQVEDSLTQIVVKKFPSGSTNLSKKLNELDINSKYGHPDTAMVMYTKFVSSFKLNDGYDQSRATESLLNIYRRKFDFENFNKVINSITMEYNRLNFKAQQCNKLAWSMVSETRDLPLAKLYSERSLQAYDSLKIENEDYGHALDTYAFILYKQGNIQEAVNNQMKAVQYTKSQKVDINSRYIKYINANNQPKETLLAAQQFILNQKSNNEIDSLYKVAYSKVNSSNSDSEFNSLKEKQNEAYYTELKNQMLDIPAPDFELKDINGNTVKLSELKGSIIVIDFWATWCGPCVASFPAMQKVINRTKNKNVKFYFINTSENTPDITRKNSIQKTLENKQVSLKVLLDRYENNSFKVADLFNVKGIPAKFIIDKKGKIRFNVVGFSGEDNTIKELESMIDIIDK